MTTTAQPAGPSGSEAPLMLSVSGMRGIVGRSLTPPLVSRYAAAFGSWLRDRAHGAAPHVVVGRDSRTSGPMVEFAAAAGLLAVGCRVTRLGVATTPGVAIMVNRHHAAGGLVITASHNPAPWNGLKPLCDNGAAPHPHDAAQLIQRFHDDAPAYVTVDGLARGDRDESVALTHRDAILPHIDADAIRTAGLRLIVDSVHGAGGPETAALLDALGVQRDHRHAEPTGRFPHAPEPTADNLAALARYARQHRADATFAQDPDADRLAILDEHGRYIGEEYTLALCARHVLRQGDVAVANLSTSRMLDDVADAVGATVVRTPVGEANVASAMRDHHAAIGGEGNGGVIWPRVSLVRDSLVGIALILELLAKQQKPLSALVDNLPRYAIVKDKITLDGSLDTDAALARLRDRFADQRLDTQDGVRIDWPDRWVHVRPSNTEPILRLIAEARDEPAARALIDQAREAIG